MSYLRVHSGGFARSRTRASDVELANQSERRVFQNPRADAQGHLPPRATSEARIDAIRVYPGRGTPRFAFARRRGAGEAARRGISVTLFPHDLPDKALLKIITHTSASYIKTIFHDDFIVIQQCRRVAADAESA